MMKLCKPHFSNTVNKNDEILEITPEFNSCDLRDDILVASNASTQHQEKYEEPESVQQYIQFLRETCRQDDSSEKYI